MQPAERDRILFEFFLFCTPSSYDKDEATAYPDTKMSDLVSAVNYRIFRQHFEENETDLSLLAQIIRYLAYAWQMQDKEHSEMTSTPFLQKTIDAYKAGNPMVKKHMHDLAVRQLANKETDLKRFAKGYNEFCEVVLRPLMEKGKKNY
jgi:hypothetical protein